MKKKAKLKENIQYLENLSNNLDNSIIKLKALYEKINEQKEELKEKIQKIFTKIRNELNDREDKLLEDVNNKFEEFYIKDDIITKSEKLPNKIKLSLEKKGIIDEEWKNNDKLNHLINESINIENNIIEINNIYDIIKKVNSNEKKIIFNLEESEINKFLENIKKFGFVDIDDEIKMDFDQDSNIIKTKKRFKFSN